MIKAEMTEQVNKQEFKHTRYIWKPDMIQKGGSEILTVILTQLFTIHKNKFQMDIKACK